MPDAYVEGQKRMQERALQVLRRSVEFWANYKSAYPPTSNEFQEAQARETECYYRALDIERLELEEKSNAQAP
jgi:hypothetical protein